MRIRRTLRAVAGGDRDLEKEEVQSSTRVMYAVKGLLVLAVSLLSAAIAGHTWGGEVFHSVLVGFGVAFVWFVFTLAFNMIISWKFDQVAIHGMSKWHALPLAAVLAFTIAAVNSQFILLRIYEPEIKAYIAEKHRTVRAAKEAEVLSSSKVFDQRVGELRERAESDKRSARASVESGLSTLQAEVSQLRARYDEAVKAITAEVEGKAVSKQVGDGSITRQKRQEAAEVKALLDASTARLERERARLNPQVDEAIRSIEAGLATSLKEIELQRQANESHLKRDAQELDTAPREGFLQRSAALTAVAWQQPVWAGLFFLLFAILESTVVLLKVLTGQTEYHLLRRVELAKLAEELDTQLSEMHAGRRERIEKDRAAHVEHLETIDGLDERQTPLVAKAHQRLLDDHRARGASDEEVRKIGQRSLRRVS